MELKFPAKPELQWTNAAELATRISGGLGLAQKKEPEATSRLSSIPATQKSHTGPGRPPPLATLCIALEARLADGHSCNCTSEHHTPAPNTLPLRSAARLPEALIRPMPLLLTGRGFRQELERAGALALYAPLEGGAETRLLRRMRAAGYRAQLTSARGLGDPEAFLLQSHGVRPPHLGHQSVGRGAAVGEVQMATPQLGHLFEGTAPVLLWLLEGQVLSTGELQALINLTEREPRLKIVVEMGGARALRWQPLSSVLTAAA